MGEKLKTIIVTVLATLGVLFIIIMLIPDDEEDEVQPATVQEAVAMQENAAADEQAESEGNTVSAQSGAETNNVTSPSGTENNNISALFESENTSEPAQSATESNSASTQSGTENSTASTQSDAAEAGSNGTSANTVTVNIPESAISDKTIKFKTSTLDDKEVSQDIFADYDLTLVHVWGTYCQSCIAAMGDFAALYDGLPDNVNMIGIIVDVYDGINTNVDYAKEILNNNGAHFTNLRVSDEVYGIVSGIQFIPSSFIVDKDGHPVGALMDGASFKEVKETLYSYLN